MSLGTSDDPEFLALCREFVRSCEGRARALEQARVAWPDKDSITATRTVAHNLAGIAATFGFPELQTSSERLEELLLAERLDESEVESEVLKLIHLLRRTASR